MPSKKKLHRRHRRAIFILVAISLGIGLALLCSEIALRVYVASRGWTPNCYATGLVFFVPDSKSGHTLRPGLRLKSSTYDIRVNDQGLRGPELRNEPDATRIAVLGGSSVFGYLVPEEEDSCRVLESRLIAEGLDVEVLNAGVPGFNLSQVRHRFEELIAPMDPEYVVLYLGWNDLPFLIGSPEHSRTPPAPPLYQRVLSSSVLYGFLRYRVFPPKAPQFAPPAAPETAIEPARASDFRNEFAALLEAIKRSGAIPIVSTQVMAASSHCEDLDEYLGNDLEQVTVNRKLGNWILDTERDIAASQKILLIDCAAELSCNKTVLGDAIHLTREGHVAVADLWAKSMLPIIEAASVDTPK